MSTLRPPPRAPVRKPITFSERLYPSRTTLKSQRPSSCIMSTHPAGSTHTWEHHPRGTSLQTVLHHNFSSVLFSSLCTVLPILHSVKHVTVTSKHLFRSMYIESLWKVCIMQPRKSQKSLINNINLTDPLQRWESLGYQISQV